MRTSKVTVLLLFNVIMSLVYLNMAITIVIEETFVKQASKSE